MIVLSKRFSRREELLLLVLAVILVAATYYWLVQVPVSTTLSELKRSQEDAQVMLSAMEQKVAKQVAMQKELKGLLITSETLETPEYDNLEQVMIFLNTTLADTIDYDLEFEPVEHPAPTEETVPSEETEQTAPSPLGKTEPIVRRVVKMDFNCLSYPVAKGVIEALEKSPFRCQLGDLTLMPGAPRKEGTLGRREPFVDLESGMVRVKLTATFYEIDVCAPL